MRAVKVSQVGLAERNAGDINRVLPPQLVQGCVRDLALPRQRDHIQNISPPHHDVWEVHELSLGNRQRVKGDPITEQVDDHPLLAAAAPVAGPSIGR